MAKCLNLSQSICTYNEEMPTIVGKNLACNKILFYFTILQQQYYKSVIREKKEILQQLTKFPLLTWTSHAPASKPKLI
jgi:hypothetical protein